MEVSWSLANKVAVVTGAASGIGRATCEELGEAGARLILVGRRAALLEEAAVQLRTSGFTALAVPADVREFSQMVAVVNIATDSLGPIDIFVANAGAADRTDIHQADPDEWRQIIETNVLGVLFGVRAVLPGMYARGSGHIIIVSSVSGRVTYLGQPAYVASKHASVAFGDVLRQEAGPRGVRVTLVEPGGVDTPLVHALEKKGPSINQGVERLRPEDCARMIRFALEQPPNCCVSEIVVRPTAQQV